MERKGAGTEMRAGFEILLALPQGPMHRSGSGYGKALRYAPLALPLLAALVPPELEASVRLVDEGTRQLDPERIEADLVGLSVMTGTARRAYALADRLRERGITVVLGGPHPTLVPEEASAHADAVAIGAAEVSWPRMLRDWASGRLASVYPEEPLPPGVRLPLPRRDLLDRKAYVVPDTIQATRGCCNSCDFCAVAAASGRRLLHRPIGEVIAEAESLPGRNLLLLDPSPLEDLIYAARLLREMAALGKRWVGCASVRLAGEPELLRLLEPSGCKGLLIGFESFDQHTLDRIGKGFARAGDCARLVRELHDRGVAVQGCFVLGCDGDTPDVFDRTIEQILAASIDLPQLSAYTPFPGTVAYRRLLAEGRIVSRDWSRYDCEQVVFEPSGMTREQLTDGLLRVWREVYSMRAISRRLLGSRCLLRYSIPANLAYRRYAHRLPELAGPG